MITASDAAAGRSWLGRGLNLLGVAVVAFFAWRDSAPTVGWVTVVGGLALASWVAVVFVPRRRIGASTALLAVMVIAGAVVTVPTNGILVIVVAVGVLRAVVDPDRPLWQGLALGIVAVAIIPISGLFSPITPVGIVSIEAGVVVALLAGLSRRQFRAAETQARQLLEERVAAREEQARASVLASRQQVARDIHDVLAHSLGGLVIQLDAVDALLEAGRTTDAAGRVRDARALAVSGLAEARRAVAALRDVDAGPVESAVGDDGLVGELRALAEAHRALGGEISFVIQEGRHARELAPAAAEALRRAFQESLTNARKHAPGQPVTATLTWAEDDGVELRVENPVLLRSSAGGAGHGLIGMSERFAAIPGAHVSAGERHGAFVVSAQVAAS